MPTIAIVEDHNIFRNFFAKYCTQLGFDVVIMACNGVDLQNQLLNVCIPDVIFMDIQMPLMDGKQATAFVISNYPSVKVIALSLYIQEKHIIDMLNVGAKGYLSKIINNESEVAEAVYHV